MNTASLMFIYMARRLVNYLNLSICEEMYVTHAFMD